MPRIFMGEPKESAIIRGQEREVIKCSEPQFKDYACMSQPDMERLIRACVGNNSQ